MVHTSEKGCYYKGFDMPRLRLLGRKQDIYKKITGQLMGWESAVRCSFFTRCKGGMKNCCSVLILLHYSCQAGQILEILIIKNQRRQQMTSLNTLKRRFVEKTVCSTALLQVPCQLLTVLISYISWNMPNLLCKIFTHCEDFSRLIQV